MFAVTWLSSVTTIQTVACAGMRQSLPVMVTIKVNRVCRLGWRGLPERVDYAPTTGKQELFPSASLELCDVPCNVRELRTRVDLATR
jgi:hypothetical protein